MSAQFNLLPKEPKKTKEVEVAISYLKKATQIIIVVLLIVGPIVSLSLFKFTRDLNTLKNENQTLRENITSLESTEQGLVLLKDRLAKIQTLLSERKSFNLHAKQESAISSLPEKLTFDQVELGNDTSRIEITATSSRSLASFLRVLSQSDQFTSLTVSGLNFSPYVGYTFNLHIF